MEKKIKNVLAEILEVDIDCIIDNVGQNNFPKWDSLLHLRIVVALEEAFNISYTPKEIGQMHTLSNILNITETKCE